MDVLLPQLKLLFFQISGERYTPSEQSSLSAKCGSEYSYNFDARNSDSSLLAAVITDLKLKAFVKSGDPAMFQCASRICQKFNNTRYWYTCFFLRELSLWEIIFCIFYVFRKISSIFVLHSIEFFFIFNQANLYFIDSLSVVFSGWSTVRRSDIHWISMKYFGFNPLDFAKWNWTLWISDILHMGLWTYFWKKIPINFLYNTFLYQQ